MNQQSPLTREQKLAMFQQLAKRDNITTGRTFAEFFNKARLLIDHPHSYRDCAIIAPAAAPGFFYLVSRFRANPGQTPAIYTKFSLCGVRSRKGENRTLNSSIPN
jgi:hypothetical protein